MRFSEPDILHRRDGVAECLSPRAGRAASTGDAWPVYLVSYNDVGLATGVAIAGVAAGVGVDALLGSYQTLYRSPARRRVTLQPTKNGAVVGFSARW